MALGNLVVNMIVRHKAFERGMTKSKRSLRSFTAQVANTQKQLLRFAVRVVGIYALIRATKRVTREFATFEEQMAMVSTMLDKQTMHFMPKYIKAIKKMSVEFGEGTETLAKGLYDILSASIAPAKALDVLTISIKAAKGGFTTTAIAADAITTILQSYSWSAKQAGYVSDVLFTIIKRGKTTFAELGPDIGKVAALASASNITFAELAAILATLTRSIGRTDVAITGMRGILRAFLKPSKEAIPVAAKLGITLSTTALKAEGLYSILDKLSKATPEQVAQIAGRMQGMLGFIVALKSLTKSHKDYEAMLNVAGASQEAYDKMTKTLMFTLRRAKQAFIMLAVSIGQFFAPTIKLLTEHTLKATQALTKFVDESGPKIKRWAEEMAVRIVFVKDILAGFVKYLYTDWRGGISFGLNLALEEFKVFGKSLLIVMEKIWNDLAANVKVWAQRAVLRKALYATTYNAAIKEFMPLAQQRRGLMKLSPGPSPYSRIEIKKFNEEAAKRAAAVVAQAQRQGQFEGMFPTVEPISWGAVGEQIEQLQKIATQRIQRMAPPELVNVYESAQDKLNTSLRRIAEKYGERQIKGFYGVFKAIGGFVKKGFQDIQSKTLQAVNSFTRMLGTSVQAQQIQKIQKMLISTGQFKVFRPAFVGMPGEQLGAITPRKLSWEGQRQFNQRQQLLQETSRQTEILNEIKSNTRKTANKEGLG